LNKAIYTTLVFVLLVTTCRQATVPRPKGYFRIDLPKKKYVEFNFPESGVPVTFEYPEYGKLAFNQEYANEKGWFNIEFPAYKAKIYMTYKSVKDFPELMEETYRMNVKNHIAKADAIKEQEIINKENKVFGILYDLKGNTASAVQFYVTDSAKNYLRGSLYFAAEPAADSLAPVIDFFRKDILHIIETLKWEK
jgi:gliding motility-associated lipoprotein GldD